VENRESAIVELKTDRRDIGWKEAYKADRREKIEVTRPLISSENQPYEAERREKGRHPLIKTTGDRRGEGLRPWGKLMDKSF